MLGLMCDLADLEFDRYSLVDHRTDLGWKAHEGTMLRWNLGCRGDEAVNFIGEWWCYESSGCSGSRLQVEWWSVA